MGGLCSRSRKGTVEGVASDDNNNNNKNALNETSTHVNGYANDNNESGMVYQSFGHPENKHSNSNLPLLVDDFYKNEREPFSFIEMEKASHGLSFDDINDGIPSLSRALSTTSSISKQAAVKVSEVSSLLGRAGTAGLGKAVEVLDTLGSSMTNLNVNSGFTSGVMTKGNKISILAFEVANTIVKGANLMHSLSKENIRHLKEVVLPSEGVQNLISRDMDELLRIAAADKREELKIFCGEVVRFGNRCKDPQWHNLDRYLEKLGSELTQQKQLKEEAEMVMQQLMTSVHYTAVINVYKCVGDTLAILRAELKSQKKHVANLKKKSLWSKILEEVMEKFVDIVHFLHLEMHEAFGSADADKQVKDFQGSHKKLGSACLALHYANVVSQIDTLVSRSGYVPPNIRDALYQGLPPNVKSALRSRLQSFQVIEELTVPQIKDEMEKTLQWLVPIATNTTKAHHGFGWVGEWANIGLQVNRKPAGQSDLLRIETLYHADKDKTEGYILELVVCLHHLVSKVKVGNGGLKSPVKSPIRSPTQMTGELFTQKGCSSSPMLTIEDHKMLRDVGKRKLMPGISKSQELGISKSRLSKYHRLSKSSNHSPINESQNDIFFTRMPSSSVPVICFEVDRMKTLDVIDRVDTIARVM
ncbi:hypothetical protein TanjilG_03964 [Lupinus angustifolius]|uniref:DUF668 domain-containing protein n=1 Tax=Lupinus angustifolius TaxID=3871 RepID=A0A4P1RAW4_LUPAN|nr:hypothetical protein TanjilG_03964 [Lupinus angustifolius]